MRSLLLGYPDNPLFEAIFIDLLPANARDAAVKHEVLEDMAKAADKVLAEAPLASNVAAATYEDQSSVLQLSRQAPTTPSRSSPNKDPSLCRIHNKYGREAYRCLSPSRCRMKNILIKPPTPASGNAKAGRQ